MVHRRALVSVVLTLASVVHAPAQKLSSGPQVLTFFSRVDDSEQPYGLYLPPNFNPKKRYPFVMMLHGAGSNHRLALRRVFGKSNAPGETDVEATETFPRWKDVDYIVASPLARGTMGYQGIPEKDVMAVLADVQRRFLIDPDRTYLTGLSMGGGGTLWIGLSRPDLWAAIAPVCPAPPAGTSELAGNALNFPVHFFQGGADPVVSPAGTRDFYTQMKDLGTRTEYTEYPGVGHNSWENAYRDEAIFRLFSRYRREAHPNRVRFATRRYEANKAYWVTLDALTPGTLSTVDARVAGPNRVEVRTSGVDGLTLNLTDHPRFRARRVVRVSIDGNELESPSAETLSFVKRNGTWALGRAETTDAKGPGMEGPIREVFADRQLYVYGTTGDPSPEELARRRSQAIQASQWGGRSDVGGVRPPALFFRVVADRDVRESDLQSSHLVLFGDATTNSVIARFSPRLPLTLKRESDDYGLVYAFPINGHTALISSGQAWVGAQVQGKGRFGWPGPIGLPAGDEDFVLFKGTPDNVVAQGLFGRDWRLNSDDAEKLRATGVVSLGS